MARQLEMAVQLAGCCGGRESVACRRPVISHTSQTQLAWGWVYRLPLSAPTSTAPGSCSSSPIPVSVVRHRSPLSCLSALWGGRTTGRSTRWWRRPLPRMPAPAGSASPGARPALPTVGRRAAQEASRLPGHLLPDVAALGALLVVLGLLWGRARHTWYWLDEGIALGISSHPLWEIPDLLRQDASPPLYYMALRGWTALFGTSEGQTHLLSLVFALAVVPAALWAGWSLFRRRTGWVLALLAGVNPFIATYANETRMYSLVVLLALLSTATFLHAFVHRRRKYVPVFTLCLLLLMYTHNWGLLFGLGRRPRQPCAWRSAPSDIP